VAVTITITRFVYPQKDGQAELAWYGGNMVVWEYGGNDRIIIIIIFYFRAQHKTNKDNTH